MPRRVVSKTGAYGPKPPISASEETSLTGHYTFAGDLCRIHRLRAYDAVQLACALTVLGKPAALGIAPPFVTADMLLLNVASLEGLSTDDPNTHP
jgi:hypothetical protein